MLAKFLESKPVFTRFVNERSLGPGVEPLPSYLILPVQRIPRYKLLLEELVGHTTPLHQDWKELKRALELVKDVALAINEALRAQHNTETIVAIQQQFTSDVDFLAPR